MTDIERGKRLYELARREKWVNARTWWGWLPQQERNRWVGLAKELLS